MRKLLTLTRRHKALALVPVVLLTGTSGAVVAQPSASSVVKVKPGILSASDIPSEAVLPPANVTAPGNLSAAGDARAVAASSSFAGIPSVALSAYQRAAQVIAEADPTCNLPWELLAAIGRVESDHGTVDRNTLNDSGLATPGVFGPVLDGKNGTQAIVDTDAGEVDKDPTFDRAVGPMQFLPSTWSSVKVDADGDGQRDPQDIDDAALGAAVYLCSGSDDLSDRFGQESALLRYNHSQEYADLVLLVMRSYEYGNYSAVPAGVYSGTTFQAAPAVPGTTADAKPDENASEPTPPPAVAPEAGTPDGPAGDSGSDSGDPKRPAKGVVGTVSGVLTKPEDALPNLVPDVMTTLEATTSCVAAGVSGLNVAKLAACVQALLAGSKDAQ